MVSKLFWVLLGWLLCRGLYWLFEHETIFPLPKAIRNDILKNGLYHYTDDATAQEILQQQSMIAAPDKKSTFKSHRSQLLIWFVSTSAAFPFSFGRKKIIQRHAPCTKQKKAVYYTAKVHVTGFSAQQVAQMRWNLETGIAYYGQSLQNLTFALATLDEIDHKMGL